MMFSFIIILTLRAFMQVFPSDETVLNISIVFEQCCKKMLMKLKECKIPICSQNAIKGEQC